MTVNLIGESGQLADNQCYRTIPDLPMMEAESGIGKQSSVSMVCNLICGGMNHSVAYHKRIYVALSNNMDTRYDERYTKV